MPTDSQGGSRPVDPDLAAEVDFITYPPDVPGSTCGNCRYNRNGVCSNPRVSRARNQPVTDRNCCAEWDAPGTLRHFPHRRPDGSYERE